MCTVQNFRRIMEKTRVSYGLPASGPVQPQLPRVLCEVGEVCKAELGHAGRDAGVHRNPSGRSDTGRNHCSDEAKKGVGHGEVMEVLGLWAGDVQASRDIARGGHRAGVCRTEVPQVAAGQGEEAGFACAGSAEAESLA